MNGIEQNINITSENLDHLKSLYWKKLKQDFFTGESLDKPKFIEIKAKFEQLPSATIREFEKMAKAELDLFESEGERHTKARNWVACFPDEVSRYGSPEDVAAFESFHVELRKTLRNQETTHLQKEMRKFRETSSKAQLVALNRKKKDLHWKNKAKIFKRLFDPNLDEVEWIRRQRTSPSSLFMRETRSGGPKGMKDYLAVKDLWDHKCKAGRMTPKEHRAVIEYALESESWDALTINDIRIFASASQVVKYQEYIHRWRADNIENISVEIPREQKFARQNRRNKIDDTEIEE